MDKERASAELPAVSAAERRLLLGEVLRGVSRAFYLTLRVLPHPLREPLGTAYLLARAADTVADTKLLPPADRLKYLSAFRAQLSGPVSATALGKIAAAANKEGGSPAERRLLELLPRVFALWEALPDAGRRRVRAVVETLTQGMETDLRTFPPEDAGQIAGLRNAEELDRYTYYVAGCVGEFWTATVAARGPLRRRRDVEELSALGVCFGKGLQLVNILRDLPRDLRHGRCYLPEDELAGAGLKPRALLEPGAAEKVRPVFERWVRRALEHFDAAEKYVAALPRRRFRLRLAVLWPLLMGLETLALLAREKDYLNPARRVKVSRWWVYRTMLLSVPCSFSHAVVRMWVRRLRSKVESRL